MCHTLAELVGKRQFVVADVGLEAVILDFSGKFSFQRTEHQVVRGDDAAALQADELLHQGDGAPLLVGRVGAFQDFVEDDEQLLAALQAVDNHLQPLQFGKEIGFVSRQGVRRAEAGDQMGGIDGQAFGADGDAHASQQVVHAYGTQVGAFPRHVCPRDDEEPRAAGNFHVVFHADIAAEQGMAQRFSFHFKILFGELRVTEIRVVEGKVA